MARIAIQISDNAVQAALRTAPALAKLERPQGLYKIWATYLERLAVRAFQAQAEPLKGKPWKPTSPITKKLRNNKGKGLLRNSDALYSSTAGRVLGDGAAVGSSQKVGAYSLGAIHQFGAIVPITPKSRAYFRHQFRKSSNEGWDDLSRVKNDFIEIPSRKFLPMDDKGEPFPELIGEIESLTRDWLLR